MSLWPPSHPLPQHDTPELLDSRVFTREEVQRSLADVARINSFLGATQPLYNRVWSLIKTAQLKRATVLDIGCGNADFARRLIDSGRKRDVDIQVIALDISALHLEIARTLTPSNSPIEFVKADAFHLPLPDSGADIVTSTLFLHHFRPHQLRCLFVELSRVARIGWVMNDCARDAIALWSFRVLRPYLARSFITRFDGPTSIRRSYTYEEMRTIVSSQTGVTVTPHFPYRLQVEWTKVND